MFFKHIYCNNHTRFTKFCQMCNLKNIWDILNIISNNHHWKNGKEYIEEIININQFLMRMLDLFIKESELYREQLALERHKRHIDTVKQFLLTKQFGFSYYKIKQLSMEDLGFYRYKAGRIWFWMLIGALLATFLLTDGWFLWIVPIIFFCCAFPKWHLVFKYDRFREIISQAGCGVGEILNSTPWTEEELKLIGNGGLKWWQRN